VIGNEAVWTVEPDETDKPALLGMDLVRLGLERGSTSAEALDTITQLLETHGSGGACAENDPSFTYHNSFLIASVDEAYVLETAGRHWVAERVTKGARNISNGLTIRTDYDLHSKGLHEYAVKQGMWDGKGKLDFAECFSEGGVDESPESRYACGSCLMNKHINGSLDVHAMQAILKDHESGICMHGSFETTASMVSELGSSGSARHWMTGKPHPCKSPFELQSCLL
jgi:secernin